MTTYLAVEVNPYRVRLAIVADRVIWDTFEAKHGKIGPLLAFVRRNLPPSSPIRLTGRRYDRWPPELLTALVQEFGPVAWINPTLLNSTLPDVERWRSRVKFYRALFLAICAERHDSMGLSILDRFELLHDWSNAALDDLAKDEIGIVPKRLRAPTLLG